MRFNKGKIQVTQEDLPKLAARGYDVDKHTDFYMNNISASAHGITVGFYNWNDNLDCFITTVGEDGANTEIKINNRQDLNKVMKLMDALVGVQQLKEKR